MDIKIYINYNGICIFYLLIYILAILTILFTKYGTTGPVGPTGTAGPAGPTGPTGPAGSNGSVGPAGPAGSNGTVGPAGPAGSNGTNGPAGSNGTNGLNGIITLWTSGNAYSENDIVIDPDDNYNMYRCTNDVVSYYSPKNDSNNWKKYVTVETFTSNFKSTPQIIG